jgi:hydrogenase maturation protein HypF
MALAHLWAAGIPWDADLPCVRACSPGERTLLRQQLDRAVNCVPTSSMGRLFDTAASLTGVRHEGGYEGHAAMELEALAGEGAEPYPFAVTGSDPVVIDPGPLLAAVVADLRHRSPVGVIASRFHATVVEVVRVVARVLRSPVVGLTGGVFQNVTLLKLVSERLRADGRTVLTHRQVPCNDGGLSLGQVVITRGIR